MHRLTPLVCWRFRRFSGVFGYRRSGLKLATIKAARSAHFLFLPHTTFSSLVSNVTLNLSAGFYLQVVGSKSYQNNISSRSPLPSGNERPTEPPGQESATSQASSGLTSGNLPQDDASSLSEWPPLKIPLNQNQRTGPSDENSVEVPESSGPQTPDQPHSPDAGSPGNDSSTPTINGLANWYRSRNTSDNDAYRKVRSRWILIRNASQFFLFIVILAASLGCYFNETVSFSTGDFELVCYQQPEACKGPEQIIWHTFEKEICSPANEQVFCGEEVEEMWTRYEHAIWGDRDEDLEKMHALMIWQRIEPSILEDTIWTASQGESWPAKLQESWDELRFAYWPFDVHHPCYTIQRFNYQLGCKENLKEKWASTQQLATIIATAFALELCLILPMFFDTWKLAVGNLIFLGLSFIVYCSLLFLQSFGTQFPKSVAEAVAYIVAISFFGHALGYFVSSSHKKEAVELNSIG